MAKKIGKTEEVFMMQPKIKTIKIRVRGLSPLLMEKMDENIGKIYDKKKSKQVYEEDTRSEKEKTKDKIHHTKSGNVGFPAAGFHKGMIECAPYLNMYKKNVRETVTFIDDIIPIDFKKQDIHETWGRSSGRNAAPRYIVRPQFNDWYADLNIRFNESAISVEQIVNLLKWSGFQCGVGGWRPQKGGTFGQYTVCNGEK